MFSLVQFHKDNSVFPVRLNISSVAEAGRALAWQKIGAGEREDWRIITMTELRELLHAGKVDLSAFTPEAQAEKRAVIEVA